RQGYRLDRRVEDLAQVIEVIGRLPHLENGRRRPFGDADRNPVGKGEAHAGRAHPGQCLQTVRQVRLAEQEEVAVTGQMERVRNLRGRQVFDPDDLDVSRAKGGLRQQEEQREDLTADEGDLQQGPQPPAAGCDGLGRRRRAAAAAFCDGANGHASVPRSKSLVSIAVCERCLSLKRSMASSTSRSIKLGYDRPDASQSFGYMLIRVKPGMVFSSFSRTRPVARSMKKSTRAMPATSTAWKARTASARTSSATPASIGAGMSSREPSSRYFAS